MSFDTEKPNHVEQESGAYDRSNSASKPANKQLMKCSICGNQFDRTLTKTPPFCSRRCHQIDLGNWLSETYGLPVESGDGEYQPDENQD